MGVVQGQGLPGPEGELALEWLSLHSAAAGEQPQTPSLPAGLFKWWLKTETSIMAVKHK